MKIDYDMLTDKAHRFLIKESLKLVQGDSNNCNIYIAFYTKKNGVVLSERLQQEYPDKMAIILQHEFYKLTVNNSDFSVELSFNGILEKIRVPFSAIETFHDKDANFYLKLNNFFSDNNNTIASFEDEFDSKDKIISIDRFLK